MIRVRVLAGLLPVVLLSGCFQLRALLRIADNGSAVLEETVLISGMLREMLESDTSRASALYVLDSLRANASRLGDGVTLLRVDTLRESDAYGYRAVYSVEDVSALRFRFNPNPVPGVDQSRPRASASFLAGTSDELAVTFEQRADGSLRILLPRQGQEAAPVEPPRVAVAALADTLRRQTQTSPEMAAALDGIRFGLEVTGPGPIDETDARFSHDSTVILFDYSMGAFFGLARDKPELIARTQLLERAGTPDHAPVLHALAMHPGVRYEPRPVVTIRFGR